MKHLPLVAAFLWFSVGVNAEPILQPEGLKPGDQYRLTFTTSTKRDATSSNIQDYNDFVQATADAAPVVGSWDLRWTAIVATEEVGALENTVTDYTVDPGVPVYRVDGVLFGEGNVGLWNLPDEFDRKGIAAPNVDEIGNLIFFSGDNVTDLFVWTGTFNTGTPIPETIPLGSPISQASYGNAGSNSKFTNFWVNNAATTEVYRFYALSEIVTVVPEPVFGGSWLIVLVLYLASSLRTRRNHQEAYATSLLSVFFCCHVCTAAELIRQPADLRPGDQYRLAFVTSTNRDATLKRAEEYNAYVQSVADASPVGDWGLSWNVIGETRDVSARENSDTDSYVETGVPIYRLDGERIWDDYVHLWGTKESEGPLALPYVEFDVTELGTELEQNPGSSDGPFVWTGTNHFGSSRSDQYLGDKVARMGSPHRKGLFFINDADFTRIDAHFYAISEILTAGLVGDFDDDGLLTATDIDLLSEQVRTASADPTYDLNSDGVLDSLDRTEWVEQLANTNFGDSDLNGEVAFNDFLAIANNFDQSAGWAGGDFDGNGMTDFQDFLALANNFGASRSTDVAAIPEPASLILFLNSVGLLALRKRKPCFEIL